ncbi:MAG TPA: tyrosine-protein phosphatase, partial [Nocardioides sp.]|nr:tyrosine-protein phosphatase [Nocardioides sp.]
AIIDLRSPSEIERHPDPEVPGARALHFDAIGIPIERLGQLTTHADALALMEEVYRSFVTVAHSREAFGAVLRQLAEDGPQLFHCAQGKDRTGWVAALLLHIAGVDDATIEADYLITNARTAASRGRVEAEIMKAGGSELLAVFEPTLIVDVAYLRDAWATAEKESGDRAGYLRDGLGLDDATVDRLRERFLL